jgi:hypothetical protein
MRCFSALEERGVGMRQLAAALVLDAGEAPELAIVSSTLYDLTLLHEMAVLLANPAYETTPITRPFRARDPNRLRREDRARVLRMTLESPLFLDIALGASLAAGGLWAFVQSIERIRNWPLNREKLRQEMAKVSAERQLVEMDLDEALYRREAREPHLRLVRRLESGPPAIDVDLRPVDIPEDHDSDV